MSIALDLILIGIVLLCGWRGFRTGIINGVCGILAIIIALYGANLVSTVYYSEFTGMAEPFTNGIVDSAIATVMEWNGTQEKEKDIPIVQLSPEEKSDPEALSYAVYRQVGLIDSVSQQLSEDTAQTVDEANYTLSEEITNRLCDRVVYVALFTIAFLLIAIVFSVIGNIFDLSFGLPGHENINHITGAVLGVAKGILLIIIIGCVFRYACLVIPEDTIADTWLLENLTVSNKLASILGI